jgi:ribulose 1,5-bisphosphate carboxylase large subunit-like protein
MIYKIKEIPLIFKMIKNNLSKIIAKISGNIFIKVKNNYKILMLNLQGNLLKRHNNLSTN